MNRPIPEPKSRRRGRHANAHRARQEPSQTRRIGRFVNRNTIAIAAFLGAGHLLLTLVTFLPQPHTGGDNAAYISLGQSLLTQFSYSSLWDPATPPHTQYPPVFPAILAAGMLVGLQPFASLKILISLMSAGAVAATFVWLRNRRRPVLALGIGVLLALSPGVLELAHWILSDVPFWFFTMLALWGFERLRPELRARFLMATAAVALAYFTRSAGLPLLLAAFAWLSLKRRWSQLAIVAATTIPLAFLWWLRARSQGGVDYISQFWFVNPYSPELGRIGLTDLFGRAAENAIKYVRIHMPILLTGRQNPAALLVSVGIYGLALAGWIRRMRRPALTELFTPLYAGLLLIWPAVWSGERFLLPVLPLILFYAADMLVRLVHRVRRGATLAVAGAALATLIVMMLPAQADAVRASARCMVEYRTGDRYPCLPLAWRDWFAVAEWAGTAMPDEAVVLSRKPTLFHVIGGRRGLYYPMSPEPAELIRAARTAGARYIVLDHLDGLSQLYLAPAVTGRIQAFCIMHSSPIDDTVVLGILDGAESMPDAAANPQATVPPCGPEYWSREALRTMQNR